MNLRNPDLIDIGANLTHDSFDQDRAEVVRRAADAGVRRMIVTGASMASTRQAIELATESAGQLFATAGVHPHHATELTETAARELHELVREPVVVAAGECGLDYFRDFCPRDAQRHAFELQLDIAIQARKPLFLHQRDAHDDFVSILRPRLEELHGGVAHCFTAGKRELKEYLDMGLYIGITGWICDERRGQALREAVSCLPLDRVLLETDAPYLLPRDLPFKAAARRNEPAFLPHIAEVAAQYMGCTFEQLARAATANTERLFRLPETGPD